MVETKTTRAGKVGITPQGPWSATFNNSHGYNLLDEVLHNFDAWISLTDENRDEPTASSPKWFRSTQGGQYAHEQGEAAAAATTEANRLDISLSGMTITITRRDGSTQVQDIGFEIFRTYVSVAAMNADASNVPQGKFVIIATADTTSEENARLYCKNSQGSFTFLSDLDQASSAAWADWLNNHKPVIEADHTRAENDHSTAAGDHTTASQDHTTANNDHTTATDDHQQTIGVIAAANGAAELANTKAAYAQQQGDYAKQQGDYAKTRGDYPDQIRSDGYVWTYNPQNEGAGPDGYYRTNYKVDASIDFDALTPEQYETLVQRIQENMIFASTQTCEDVIGELT